ncbi:Ig-like domain-containing protein [Clostridium kluyveri]|uniref:SbsA Ig-like domain-containing protein n=2 Tax=Clostridium kluyveri TaxID=1534 RepID=A5MYZ5_CLOK5|nr:Ig-like domain-containing protein [Clostridium kluyveri]EDK34091.1 Hypothetical protein CKL_2079 [Clostridium kluyveri DSM 555]BAH06874.1 hypothetical protein CKR_1823 [Clostridium kluyveri NBRC 12016]
MKKYIKKVQAILTALFFVFSLVTLNNFTAFAASNNEVNEFPAKKNISIYKNWTVVFTSPINLNTINNENITVTDSNSNLQSVDIKPGNDNKSIIINCPVGGYSSNQTYYINISNKVTSASSKPLKKPIKMTFTTSSEKEISNINTAVISNNVIQIDKNDSENIESHIINKTENENNNQVITLDSTNTGLSSSKPGDIFLMKPTKDNPLGSACKIISNNTTSDGKNVLEIAQPRIDEVLSEANFNIEKSLNEENLISSTFPKGTTISFVKSIDSGKSDLIASLHNNTLADVFQGEDIHISLPPKEYSLDGIEIDNEPSIVLRSPKIMTALDIKKVTGIPTEVRKLEARLNTTIECEDNLNVKGNGEIQGNNISKLLGCDNSNKLALGNITLSGVDMNNKIILGSMTYQIGALPVETIYGIEKIPFGATIFLYLTFDGKIEAEVNVNMKASCYVDKGIDINGTTANNEKSDNTKTNFTINGTASGDLKMGIGAGMGLIAMGIVPADITADVIGDINGTVSGEADILNQTYSGTIDCNVSLKLLSEGNFKIAITDGNLSKELSKKINFLDKTLYDWKYTYPKTSIIQDNVTKLIDYLPTTVNGEKGVTFETRDQHGVYKNMIKVDKYIDEESHVYWGTDNPYYYLPAILNVDMDNEQFLAHPSAINNAGVNLDNITCVKLNGNYGKVNVSGIANLNNSSGSVRFYIYKGKDNYSKPLWQSINGGDFNLDIPYNDGDELYFGVDANGDDLYDWAIWQNVRFQAKSNNTN